MQKLVLSGIFLFLIVFPSYAFADGPYLNIPPTNAFDKIHTDNGTITAANFSMPLNIKSGSGCTVLSSNGTHTVTISCSGTPSSNEGTYNKTLANNSVINSGGYRINFINGTNNPVTVTNDPTRSQVNVTISSTGSGGSGVTSLNALSGALTIACVAGNTTCTTSGGNTITINTAYNIATLNLNEIFSGITTMNNLKLGGQMNINGQTMQSFGHVYSWQNHTGTVCLTNQTTACGPGSSATYDTMQNVGTGEASVYKGNNTNTNFQFKTLKQGSHITLTNNTSDITIGTTGLLSSALLSLNGDTTAAQVVASGNTNHITVTNAGANHNIDIAFKVNNATCSAGYFVSSYSNVTGIYSCSLGNSGTITGITNIGHGGKGFGAGVSGSNIQIKNLTSLRTDIFTVNSNTTDVTLSSNFKSNNISCAAGNAVTSFNNSTGTYTCSPFGSLSNAITSINSQTGPAVSIIRQPSYTTITNNTNSIKVGIDAAGVMELNGTQTATGSKTFNALVLGGDANAGSNGFTNAGHKSTFPLTTGTLCQTNQTTTCGTNSGVTSITGTAHNVTASSSTGAVTLNTGDNVFMTNGATQNITKATIMNGGLTMSHSNINLGTNQIQTTNYNLNESNTVPPNAGILIEPKARNSSFVINFAANGIPSSKTSFLSLYRTLFTTTNYERLLLGSDLVTSNEYGIKSDHGATGNNYPINFYMDNTKEMSINTANTITSYVNHLFSGGITMSGSNINLGSNKIKTTNFDINDTTVAGLPSILLNPSAASTASIISLDPGTSSSISRTKYFRTSNDIGTNYEVMDIGSEINGVAQTFGIKMASAGTGSLRPFNFYMNTVKLFSFDTTNTLTSYVQNIWTPISDPVTSFTNAIWKSSTTADVLKYRNNANTTTYNIVSTLSATNATRGQLSGNGTGTTSASMVMDGVYATITPANTGRITVHVSGTSANSVAGDGCNIGIRQSTSNMGANGVAVAGTILGDNLQSTSGAAAEKLPFSRIYDYSGAVGTKQFFDLSFARVTGGTCTLTSVNWDLVEH